jgi:membrane protein DedA with SNARE-associated domain
VLDGLSLVAGISDRILSLPTWLIVGLVFLIPALEASAFLGFIFPGEIAVILGGVAAYQGRVSLVAVIVAAILGAVLGDSVGYFIGKRWGSRLLKGTVGRLPVIRKRIDEHLESARAYVRRRKGRAVFFGRFTAALRVLVPGLAGMSEVHYPSFLFYNVLGGVLWGGGFALLGYLAGASYQRVAKIAGRVGLVLLALVVVGLILSRVLRLVRARSPELRARAQRLVELRPIAWARRRFVRQIGWVGARLDPASPRGFGLTFTVAAGALAAWTFGGLTQDVIGHDEMALLDPRVTRWVVAHREASLTAAMKTVTWLGSNAVVIPALVLVAAFFLVRRRDWRPGAKLASALGGAVALYDIEHRHRPLRRGRLSVRSCHPDRGLLRHARARPRGRPIHPHEGSSVVGSGDHRDGCRRFTDLPGCPLVE